MMKAHTSTYITPSLPLTGHLKLTANQSDKIIGVEILGHQSRIEMSSSKNEFLLNCSDVFFNYLSSKSRKLDIPFELYSVTPFQNRVLQEISQIPFGETLSYKALGDRIGTKAYQAVGGACKMNPLILLIPCHRVVGTLDLGGYVYGRDLKVKLIHLEK
jgi:O-6-methylguanine DNA methyltransferase